MTSHAVLFSSIIRTTCFPLVSTSLATRCRNPPRTARYTNRPQRFPRNQQEASCHPSSRPSKRVPNRRLLTPQLRRLNRIRRVSIILSFMSQTKREHKVLSVLNLYFIGLHQQMHFVLSRYYLLPPTVFIRFLGNCSFSHSSNQRHSHILPERRI